MAQMLACGVEHKQEVMTGRCFCCGGNGAAKVNINGLVYLYCGCGAKQTWNREKSKDIIEKFKEQGAKPTAPKEDVKDDETEEETRGRKPSKDSWDW